MPHVPKPQRGSTVSQGLFPKERSFHYDGGEDIYICPDGQRLALHSKRKRRDLIFASYSPIAPRASQLIVEVYEKRLPSGPALCRRSDPGAHSQNDWRPARSCSMRAVKASSNPLCRLNQTMDGPGSPS